MRQTAGHPKAVRTRPRKLRSGVMAIAAAALVLGACSGGGSDSALTSDDAITVGLGGDPMTMSPYDLRAGVNLYGSSQMYERLLGRDAKGKLIPWLATEWDVSDDGLTYTFELRDDVTFHSGQKMTSEDVKFSIERYSDPEIMPYASLIGSLESIDTPDKHTVVVNFSTPVPVFLTGMGMTFIVPASIGDEPGDYLDAQADGTGPFKLASRSAGQGFTLERFDDYWGEPSGFASVDVKVIADSNARVSSLRSGQTDFIVPVPSQNVSQLEDSFNVELANDSNTVGVAFNLEDESVSGALSDQRVRRALDLAIDRQAIVDTALNGMGIVHGGVGPQNEGDDQVPAVKYDPEEAKKLIEDAGAVGESITFYVPKNGRVTGSEQVGQAVAAYWNEAGVKTDLRIVSYEEWIDKMRTGPAQAILSFQGDEIAWSPVVRFQGWYSCDGSTGQICDKDLDKLLGKALTAPSNEASVDAYVSAFQQLQDTSQAINMYVQESAFAMSEDVCWSAPVGRSIPVLAELKPCD